MFPAQKKLHGWIVLGLGFILTALLVVGCGGTTPAPSPTPTPIAAPTPGVAPSPTPIPRATPPLVARPTGELRMALPYLGVEALDPTLGPASGKGFLAFIYDSLVGVTSDVQFNNDYGLAEKWELSPDKKTWTFRLRKGVRFHNGDELTSEDVKFSIERFMSPKSVSSFSGTLKDNIERIETPDPYTVVIRTKKPYGFLHAVLSNMDGNEGKVMPKKYIQEKGEEYFNLNPVGTGPYRFREQVIGSYIRLEAVENHWSGVVPKFQRITLFLVPEETTRVALLKTGAADIAEVSRERVKELKGFNIFTKPGATSIGIWIDGQWDEKSYLYDKRVREALNLSINRDEVLQFIFVGQGIVNYGAGFFWASLVPGYEPGATYPFDPERAKRLLSEAFPGGVSLDMYVYPRPGASEAPQVAEAVSSYWGKVGVKTKLIPVEYGTYRAKKAKGELRNTVAIHGTGFRVFPSSVWRVLWHSKGLLAMAKDPKLDALIEAADGAEDMDQLKEHHRTAAKYFRDNHITGGLVETGEVYATNPQKVKEWSLGKVPLDYNIAQGVR